MLAVSAFFNGENSSSRGTSKATKFLVERRVRAPASPPPCIHAPASPPPCIRAPASPELLCSGLARVSQISPNGSCFHAYGGLGGPHRHRKHLCFPEILRSLKSSTAHSPHVQRQRIWDSRSKSDLGSGLWGFRGLLLVPSEPLLLLLGARTACGLPRDKPTYSPSPAPTPAPHQAPTSLLPSGTSEPTTRTKRGKKRKISDFYH